MKIMKSLYSRFWFDFQLLGGGEFGDDRDDSNDLKYGGGPNGGGRDEFGPGDLDGRATMVPPTTLSTMRVSFSIPHPTSESGENNVS